jgi:transketolase
MKEIAAVSQAEFGHDPDTSCFIALAGKMRRDILDLVYRTRSPHIGSSFSIVEILVSLYFEFLSVSPVNPEKADRDRFILSKGHACPALYAVLRERGFLTEHDLDRFACAHGLLEQHPNRDLSRGIEVSTGSVGHGLSIAAGMALAARNDKKDYRVVALMGDGELNEGSVWEAAMFASHHRLDNLIAIIDYNHMQALGFTRDIVNLDPLGARWSSFGWSAEEIDGHDFGDLFCALEKIPLEKGKPSAIIAHTIKGKGVTFMENALLWHYRCPDDDEYRRALQELT